nr:MAG TPA: hypothetical protein [Caudoviricetes sp.]
MTPSARHREEGFPDARKTIKPLTVGNRSGFNFALSCSILLLSMLSIKPSISYTWSSFANSHSW